MAEHQGEIAGGRDSKPVSSDNFDTQYFTFGDGKLILTFHDGGFLDALVCTFIEINTLCFLK